VKKIFRKSLRDLLFHDSGSNTTTPAAKPRLRQQNHDSSSSTTIPAAAPRFRQQHHDSGSSTTIPAATARREAASRLPVGRLN